MTTGVHTSSGCPPPRRSPPSRDPPCSDRRSDARSDGLSWASGFLELDEDDVRICGTDVVARVFYLNLFPQAHFTVWKMEGNVGLPLRFPMYDNVQKSAGYVSRQKGFVKASSFITPRKGDYRNFFDAQRLVRHFEMGGEEDQFSLSLSRTRAHTLAHGDLLKDLVGEGLYDQDHLFMSGRGELGPVQVNTVLGPLVKAHIFGLNTRFQPLSAVDAHSFVKDINVDVTYVGDYFAPLGPVLDQEEAFVLNKERRLLSREEGNAQAFSVGASSSFYPRTWVCHYAVLYWDERV